ncbi:yersiniabactin ABC transporter ATP-binding/permease protein YbtP [Salmonella enterica subsp. enterica serovar Oslo]|nr:yersiniabactin ABC transporter ATP-binding/permease protein YbtP [Salmonella enterica subsp. enterica serovar Oslo]ECG6798072.1 yersiniabactin ABC transporter ATP-binding/permease protein YbtP [Salmonella enterica subsp. enterica serovar Oslo]
MSSQSSNTESLPRFPLWQVITPVRQKVIFAMALAGLAALASLGTLLFLAWGLRDIRAKPDIIPVWQLCGLVGSVIVTFVLRLEAFNASHYAAFRLENILRARLAHKVLRLSAGALQQVGSGSLAKVMLDDVKSLHIFVADSIPLYARAIVMPLATTVILFWMDWRLAIATLGVLAFGATVLVLARQRSENMSQRYHQAREQVSAAVIEFVQAMPVVRMFDSGSNSFLRYQHALEEWVDVLKTWYWKAGFSARFSFSILNPLPTLFVLIWSGYGLLHYGSFDFIAWVAVLLLGSGMAEAVMPMMMLNNLVAQTRLSIERIYQVLAMPELSLPLSGQQPKDAGITFEQVSFHYPQARTGAALKEVSFHVPAGKIVALVGSSGAGKSTVARLLLRYADPDKGHIRIGGVDLRDMQPDTLMKQVSFVFQDNFLFADTIANNIRLGAPDTPLEAVIAAARVAQAHEFISALPEGYNTRVGERGVFLSGGQRQRITIARALLQNRPILVLDEATAFADPENEAALIKALAAAMRGRTVIMVAHRLSMVTQADVILLFADGQLRERGSHAQLLELGGLYQRLWQRYQQAQHWLPDGVQEEVVENDSE